MPLINIDEKLFGHINGDAYLAGSYGLEGNTFKTTILYLTQFITGSTNLKLHSELIDGLQQMSKRLSHYESLISAIKTSDDVLKFAIEVLRDVQTTKPFIKIYMPGGWKNKSNGHALLYEFYQDNEGNLFFTVINSGAGLLHHRRQSSLTEELYDPFLCYRIPQYNAILHDLGLFIADLIYPMTIELNGEAKKISYDEDYLYLRVFPKIHYVKGELVKDPNRKAEYLHTAGQLSGTCTQRVLHQLLKSYFSSEQDYRLFMYRFKTHALYDYVNGLTKDNRLSIETYHPLLETAIQHNLRILQTIFSAQEQLEESKPLLEILTRITQVRANSNPNESTIEQGMPTILTIPGSLLPTVHDVSELLQVEPQFYEIPSPMEIKGGIDLLSNMQDLLENSKQLLKNQQNDTLIEQLEYFFTILPLPNSLQEPLCDYYASLVSSDEVYEFNLLMYELQRLYYLGCQTVYGRGVVLPRMLVVKQSIIAVTTCLTHTYPFTKNGKQFLDEFFIEAMMDVSNRRECYSVYRATNHPRLDQRLISSTKLKTSRYISGGLIDLFKYYNIIVSEIQLAPEFVGELKSKFHEKYGLIKSELCKKIKRYNLEAAVYIAFHFDTLTSNGQHPSLYNLFKKQWVIESLCISFNKGCPGNDWLNWNPRSWPGKNFNLNNNDYFFYICGIPKDIEHSVVKYKYSLINPIVFSVLSADEPFVSREYSSENANQLNPMSPKLDGCKPAARELWHLRRSPLSQIRLSIDYFNREHQKLTSNPVKTYLEANLCQPALLLHELALEHEQQFLNQFDSFINNGLHVYQKNGLLTQDSVFFIRLNFLISDYAILLDPARFASRFFKVHLQLTTYLSTQVDKNIQASLHRYRFLTGQRLLELEHHFEAAKDALFGETLRSYFYIMRSNNPYELLDKDWLNQVHLAIHKFKRYLSLHPELTTIPLVQAVISDLTGDEPQIWQCQGRFPVYDVVSGQDQANKLKLNIVYGLILKDGMAQRPIPSFILEHPITKMLGFGNQLSCLSANNDSVYILQHPYKNCRLCFVVLKNMSFNIYHEFMLASISATWFQLIGLSDEQQHQYSIKSKLLPTVNLPTYLKGGDWLGWLNTNQMILTDTKNNQIQFHSDGNPTGIWFKPISGAGQLCHSYGHINFQLYKFESPGFVSTIQHQSGFVIKLLRYNLNFFVANHLQPVKFVWNDVVYQLNNKENPFKSGIASLLFSSGEQQILILAVQPFIVDSEKKRNPDNHYYYLSQDTKMSALEEWLKEQKNTSSLWQYNGTEKYLVLQYKNGTVYPQTPGEALYLAYVYLGSHEYQLAFDMLTKCETELGGLDGTYEELHYLYWIVKGLPLVLRNDKNLSISSPPVIACQLKALAMLTNFLRQDKSIVFPKPYFDANTVNGAYERYVLSEISNFYSQIDNIIHLLFKKMQIMRRELPLRFILSDDECESLLGWYFLQSPDKGGDCREIAGAIGYEHTKLRLTSLHREYLALDTIAKISRSAEYDHYRRNQINQTLKLNAGVASIASKLVYKPINAKSIDILSYSSLLHDEEQQHEPKKVDAIMDSLDSRMTGEAMRQNLGTYLQIASTPNHKHQEKLKHFCIATLLANHKIPTNSSNDSLLMFCNVLYRIISAKKIPSGHEIKAIYEWVDLVNNLPLPPDICALDWDFSERISLITATEIWKNLPAMNSPIPPKIEQKNNNRLPFIAHFSEIWNQLKSEWKSIEDHFNQEKRKLSWKKGEGEQPFSNHEFTIGTMAFEQLKQQKDFAHKKLDSQLLLDLEKQVNQITIDLHKRLANQTAELLRIANQLLDGSRLTTWSIEVAAQQRMMLTIEELLKLYFQNDIANYANRTQLSPDDITILHSQILQFVADKLILNQLEQLRSHLRGHLKLINKNAESANLQQKSYELAKIIFADNLVSVIDDPELSILQFHTGHLLRNQQIQVLQQLLRPNQQRQYEERIEKVIMGGGKSKVILPILAKRKATGANLVVIEVPPSLLHTNYVDLKATSISLFGQTAHLFEFNRNSNHTSRRLAQLHEHLTRIMVNKDYLITTGSALQSLELKYLELLLVPPQNNATENDRNALIEWEGQISNLNQLILLFKYRADLMIDEVHQELLLKNKLNYSLGEGFAMPRSMIETSLELYQFMYHVELTGVSNLDKTKNYKVSDVLLNHSLLIYDYQYQELMVCLTKAVFTHPKSPLSLYLTDIENGDKEALRLYFLGQSSVIPDYVMQAEPMVREQFAFYKMQLSHLLAYTLRRKPGVHYGPSHLIKEYQGMVAIPYKANNVPNERSRFGNFLETNNYTIQWMMIMGMSKELCRCMLSDWLAQAYSENKTSLDETTVAAIFNTLVQPSHLRFSMLDLDDEAQFNQIYNLLSRNRACIIEVLKTRILPHIKMDMSVLHSNACNHVDLVRSCQGMSGTPSNYQTFHQRLTYEPALTDGTEGYVYNGLLAKKPKIIQVDFTNTKAFIEEIFTKCSREQCIRALIDIAATFKAVSNIEVAILLAAYVHSHAEKFQLPKPVKHILFFHNNCLSAIKVQSFTGTPQLIQLKSSEINDINQRLMSLPEERFTYYDQAHVIGVDIKQAAHAHALVMVDHQTTFDAFFQGVMRLRELVDGHQTLDLIIPSSLQDKSIKSIVQSMYRQQQLDLQEQLIDAAKLKITNLIRNNLLERLLSLQGQQSPQDQTKLAQRYQSYFIEAHYLDFFQRFGQVSIKHDTASFLSAYQTRHFENWAKLIGKTLSSPERTAMNEQLKTIVDQVCNTAGCPPTYVANSSMLGEAVEIQYQVQVEQYLEKETQLECYEKNLEPNPYTPLKSAFKETKTLNELLKSSGSTFDMGFSDNITTTINYYKTYKQQKNLLSLLKPVHALFFTQTSDKLDCIILSATECYVMIQTFDFPSHSSWLSTTQHTILAGKPPQDYLENKEYQVIIEQIRFFNGEYNLLINQVHTLSWLLKDTKQKLDFFDQYLSPNRETLPLHEQQLRTLLSEQSEVMKFVFDQYPFINEQFQWKSKYPECENFNISGYIALANALKDMRLGLKDQVIKVDWDVPLLANQYIGEHLKRLEQVESIFSSICKYYESPCSSSKRSMLASLKDHELASLLSVFPELKLFTGDNPVLLAWVNEYKILTFLMPFLPKKFLKPMMLMAMPGIYEQITSDEIKQLLPAAENNPYILYGLLINPTVNMEIPWVDSLVTQINDCYSFEAILQHKHLSALSKHHLIEKAMELNCSRRLLEAFASDTIVFEDLMKMIAEHPRVSNDMLAYIFVNTTQSSTFSLVTKNPLFKHTQQTLEVCMNDDKILELDRLFHIAWSLGLLNSYWKMLLAKFAKADISLALIKQLCDWIDNSSSLEELVNSLIATGKFDDAMLRLVDAHRCCTNSLRVIIAKNHNISDTSLMMLMGHEHDEDLMKVIAEHPQVSPDTLIHICVNTTQSSRRSLVMNNCYFKHTQQTLEVCMNDDEILELDRLFHIAWSLGLLNSYWKMLLAKFAKADISLALIKQLCDWIDNSSSLEELVNSLIATGKFDDAMLRLVDAHRCCTNSLRVIIAKNHNISDTSLMMLMGHEHDEDLMKVIAEHPQVSPDTLIHICVNTTQSSTVSLVTKNPLFKHTQQTLEACINHDYLTLDSLFHLAQSLGLFNPYLKQKFVAASLKKYLNEVGQIKNSFYKELVQLKQQVHKVHDNVSDVQELFNGIENAGVALFDTLILSSEQAFIQQALEKFQYSCKEYIECADGKMGHGWLYQIIECLVKMISAVLVGAGMILVAPLGQGLSNSAHRETYHATFFNRHKTEASKALFEFDPINKKYTQDILSSAQKDQTNQLSYDHYMMENPILVDAQAPRTA
ncbi:MAG: DUF3638 domain-containing protein [Legionella sp.]